MALGVPALSRQQFDPLTLVHFRAPPTTYSTQLYLHASLMGRQRRARSCTFDRPTCVPRRREMERFVRGKFRKLGRVRIHSQSPCALLHARPEASIVTGSVPGTSQRVTATQPNSRLSTTFTRSVSPAFLNNVSRLSLGLLASQSLDFKATECATPPKVPSGLFDGHTAFHAPVAGVAGRNASRGTWSPVDTKSDTSPIIFKARNDDPDTDSRPTFTTNLRDVAKGFVTKPKPRRLSFDNLPELYPIAALSHSSTASSGASTSSAFGATTTPSARSTASRVEMDDIGRRNKFKPKRWASI
ncbi:hypothetical protein AAMO2058_001394700 [Amorphochlora amoebiformis]